MEDPGEEWEIGQYFTSGSGEGVCESKIERILKGGLWLGKKFVLTGFVISSAPVVLPPLVVVSALGFAVSIPFGVVLASYKCTEKLMNKLLPMPESSGMLDYYEPLVKDDMEENGEGEGGFSMEEEEKAKIQDSKASLEMRIELGEDGNKDQQQENVTPEMDPNSGRNVTIEDRSEDSLEGSVTKGSEDEKPQVVVTRVVVAKPIEGETESAAAGKGEDAEVLKAEITGLLEKVRDEAQSGESTKKNKKKNKDRQKKTLGLGLGGKKEDKIAKDTKEMEKNSRISKDEGNKDIKISGEMTKDAVLNAPVAEKPVESQSILINGNHSEGKANFVNEEQTRPEHMPVESNKIRRENTGNRVPHEVKAAKASTKISPSEKNLWEQINAMRFIVGYKAVSQPSLTEELKALYMFTGVEPPSSFRDTTNVRDAEDKLRFLMSIVGVK